MQGPLHTCCASAAMRMHLTAALGALAGLRSSRACRRESAAAVDHLPGQGHGSAASGLGSKATSLRDPDAPATEALCDAQC